MSFENVLQCPICNGSSFHPLLISKDYTTTGEVFHVEQCDDCSMVLTNPRPNSKDASFYYKSTNYISHTSSAKGWLDHIYLIFRRLTLRWKHSLIKPYLQQNLLLDVGSGTGQFLAYCKEQGVNVYGVEPSESARSHSQGITITETIDALPDIKFDVITLWHVLEHVYELQSILSKLKARLSDNGIIFIAVPNWQSYDATHYKEMWAAYDVPRHIWHFSKESMNKLLANNGLKLKGIIPMKLDAYYVSLLSEKNIGHGKLSPTNVLRGVTQGFRSNLKGARNMNHSSLIYLAVK